jgi:hypothetical protein
MTEGSMNTDSQDCGSQFAQSGNKLHMIMDFLIPMAFEIAIFTSLNKFKTI